jgi:hypothetical protein
MGETDDLSYFNLKEQNMNTYGLLPAEPTDPKGAFRCSNENCAGY